MPWCQRAATAKPASKTCQGGAKRREKRFYLLGESQQFRFSCWAAVSISRVLYLKSQGPKAASCPGEAASRGQNQAQNAHPTLPADPAAPQVLQQRIQSSISKVTTRALLPAVPSCTSPCSPSHHLPLTAIPPHLAPLLPP